MSPSLVAVSGVVVLESKLLERENQIYKLKQDMELMKQVGW